MRSENSKSEGFPFSEKDVRRVLGSAAGQQLLQLLTNSSAGELQRAAEELKRGNFEDAKEILTPIMTTPQASSLVDQINGENADGID